MPGPINRPPVMTPLTSVPTSREADGARGPGQPTATERSTAAAVRSADVLAETRRSTGPTSAEQTRGTAGLARVPGSAKPQPSSRTQLHSWDSSKMRRWR